MIYKTLKPFVISAVLTIITTMVGYSQITDSILKSKHKIFVSKELKHLIWNANKLGRKAEISQLEKILDTDLQSLTSLSDSIKKGSSMIENYSAKNLTIQITQFLKKIDSCPNYVDSIRFSEKYLNKAEYDSLSAYHEEIRYIVYSSFAMGGVAKRHFRKFEKKFPEKKYKLSYPIKTTYFSDGYFISELNKILDELNSLKKNDVTQITIDLRNTYNTNYNK